MKPPRILVRPSGDTGPREGSTPVRVPGEKVEGKVTSIEGDDVLLELTGGGRGVMPTSDFTSLPTVGDTVEALYLIDDRAHGVAVLTGKTPEREVDIAKVRPGTFVAGVVIEAGKPGLRIRAGQATGFFPASQLPGGVLRDPGSLLRQEVAGVVTELRKGEMTLSLRTVLDRRAKQRTSRRIQSFREGKRVSGTIVRKTDFGFFVDLGGIDGLLHISRLERHNEKRQGSGEEPLVLEVQQPIDVLISRVEPQRGRIGLDLPDPEDPSAGYEPEAAADEFDEVNGILRDVSAEGALVYIEEGIEGWLPARRMAGQSPRPGELRRFRVVSRENPSRIELSLQLRGDESDDDDLD